jgi:uncharacterized protein (TIGR02118 family)
MVKLIIFVKQISDAEFESFENMFSQRYVPLVNQIPNLKRATLARSIGAPRGPAPYHMIQELYFEDYATLVNALNSVQGRAAGQELMSFARDQVSMMYAESWEE